MNYYQLQNLAQLQNLLTTEERWAAQLTLEENKTRLFAKNAGSSIDPYADLVQLQNLAKPQKEGINETACPEGSAEPFRVVKFNQEEATITDCNGSTFTKTRKVTNWWNH